MNLEYFKWATAC